MHAPEPGRLHRGEVEALEHLQHLQHGEAARRRQREAADAIRAIGVADRLAHDDPVVREVGHREVAGIERMAGDRVDDVLRDRARVERVRALGGDRAQRPRIGRIAQHRADRQHLAVRIEEVRAQPRLRDVLLGREQRVQPRRQREAVLGQRDRRREERRPLEATVPAMHVFEQAHRAGHADRPAADHRVEEIQRLAVPEEAVGLRRRGRGLAAVVRDEALRLRVVQQQERAAADARRLRLREAQHELHRDRRVGGRAALLAGSRSPRPPHAGWRRRPSSASRVTGCLSIQPDGCSGAGFCASAEAGASSATHQATARAAVNAFGSGAGSVDAQCHGGGL